jgi:hypothetical protein
MKKRIPTLTSINIVLHQQNNISRQFINKKKVPDPVPTQGALSQT